MKYAVEMGFSAMIYIPNLIKISSGTQKTAWWCHKPNFITLYYRVMFNICFNVEPIWFVSLFCKQINCNNFRYFNKSMYILVLVKRYNIYIYYMVIVVSVYVDNILLKMVVLTETCKGWKIKNTTFINHSERWLKILYTSYTAKTSEEVSSYTITGVRVDMCHSWEASTQMLQLASLPVHIIWFIHLMLQNDGCFKRYASSTGTRP
jgi:hypothetical protein